MKNVGWSRKLEQRCRSWCASRTPACDCLSRDRARRLDGTLERLGQRAGTESTDKGRQFCLKQSFRVENQAKFERDLFLARNFNWICPRFIVFGGYLLRTEQVTGMNRRVRRPKADVGGVCLEVAIQPRKKVITGP